MSQTFQALGVSAPLVRALAKRHIHTPFAIQELVLPDALAGLDILAESPTGSGKTLAFGLPLVERTAVAAARARRRSCSCRHASSRPRSRPTCGRSPRRRTCRSPPSTAARRSAARRSARARRTSWSPRRDASTTCSSASWSRSTRSASLVLDEADRMLDMGFQPAGRPHPPHVPTQPADDALLGDARRRRRASSRQRYTDNAVALPRRAARPSAQPGEIEHEFVAGHARRQARQRSSSSSRSTAVSRSSSSAPSTVPTSSRKKLARRDIAAAAMHGNMSQNARERALKQFESGMSRRSSRPTSPHAGSTSTTSRT